MAPLGPTSPGSFIFQEVPSHLDSTQNEFGMNSPTCPQDFKSQKYDTMNIQPTTSIQDTRRLTRRTTLPSTYRHVVYQRNNTATVHIEISARTEVLTTTDKHILEEQQPILTSATSAEPLPSTDKEPLENEWLDGHTTQIPHAPAPALPEGYQFHPSPPTLEAYLNLRRASGLTPITPTQGARALKGGWYAVHITHRSTEPDSEEQVVAMGRIIGDGGWYFHVVDMAVLPEHQKKGLGAAVMNALMKRMEDVAEPGFMCNLFAAPAGRKLYSRHGFVAVPGALGMVQWVGGQGEQKGGSWQI